MSTKESYLPLTYHSPSAHRSCSKRPILFRFAALAALAYLFWLTCLRSVNVPCSAPPLGLPDRVQREWGQYSPWFPAGKYPFPPTDCEVTQVHVLQRHGARYPLKDDSYDESVRSLSNASKYKDSRLTFLEEYKYDLPHELLTPFGAAQSFESGQTAYRRYAHLVDSENLPFVRAASESRVVASAANWTVGFAAASAQQYNPTINVVLPQNQNNTLNEGCPNAQDGTKEKKKWLDTFAPPIRKRLQKAAPGSNITNEDVFNLMALCAFETIARQRPSDFCALFTDKEFLQFEYHGDVEKYYKTGYGEELGPIQGVGYMNELLARLTGRPVEDHTQHNDSFPFPLSRTFYADFTHENLMVAVYSAMGLFNITNHPLHTTKMDKDRNWVASEMVPFSSRMVVEKLACSGRRQELKEEVEFVRVLVNDALQPLRFCGAKQGLCTLDAFVDSQKYARHSGDGDLAKCYS